VVVGLLKHDGDVERARELWDESERLTGVKYELDAPVARGAGPVERTTHAP